MRPKNPVLLLFDSNLAQYDVTVYDGCSAIKKQVNGRQARLCLCPRSPCLRIVASPRAAGYSTLLYFWVPACQKTVNLYFSFPVDTPSGAAVNTFTLTDRSYGLPVDGSLLFTLS